MLGLRRVLDVERALSWAYVDELPKQKSEFDFRGGAGFAPVSPMFSMAALGGRVDNWSREPGYPAALGPPHPDALLIEAAVNALPTATLSCETADFAGSLLGLEPDAARFWPLATRGLVNLVRIRARLGDRPSYGEEPQVGPWLHENGQPAVRRKVTEWIGGKPYEKEVASPAMRRNTYHSGAYCPLKRTPSPAATILERAEYLAWHSALTWLAGELELDSIQVTPPDAPRQPWLTPPVSIEVLPDLREEFRPVARRRRKVAA
jgi:hypothetical protein